MIFGIVVLALGIFLVSRPRGEWIQAEAVITRVEEEWVTGADDTMDLRTDLYVDYTYEGTEYHDVFLSETNPGDELGKTVKILINPENPAEIDGVNGGKWGIYMIVVGSLLFLLGVGTIFIPGLRRRVN